MKNLAPEKVHWSTANSKSYCCYKRRDYFKLQFTKKLLYTLGFLGVFFVFGFEGIQTADASHFRGGTITWQPDPASGPNCIQFTITHIWDNFNNISPLGNPSVGDTYSDISSYNGGQSNSNHIFTVTAENETEDWYQASSTFTKCFSGPGCYTIQNVDNCCWADGISGITFSDGFQLSTTVNVNGGSCGGQQGCSQSVVIGAPPILGVPASTSGWSFQPAISNAEANTTYRFSNNVEIGGNYNPSAGLAINAATGEITWANTPAATGFHLLGITAVTGTCTTTQMFLLNIGGSVSSPPVFVGNTPGNNQVFDICVGEELTFEISADDIDPDDVVTLNVSGLPANPIPSFTPSLPTSGSAGGIATTSFSYTPTSVGSFGIIFSASDNTGAISFTNVVINVSDDASCLGSPPDLTPDVLGPDGGMCIEPGQLFNQFLSAADDDEGAMIFIDSAEFVSLDQPALVTRNNFTPALPTALDSPATTTFSWTPTPAEWGRHEFTVFAEDETGFRDSSVLALYVDRKPVFTSTQDDVCMNEGDLFTYNATADDADIQYGDSIWIRALSAPSWITVVDNGGFDGNATVSGTPGPGDVGVHTVTLRIAYLHHNYLGLHCNHVDQTFEICVDNEAPFAACDDVTISVGTNGYAVLTPTMLDNNSVDEGCGGIDTMWVSQDTFFCEDITKDQPHMVSLTVVDCAGNTNVCWSTVTVDDKIKPVIECPADIVINCTEGVTPDITGMATATDNCNIDTIVWSDVSTQDPDPTTCEHYNYTITRTFIAFDSCGFVGPGVYGLSDTCVQTIMVQDTTKPEWTATCEDFDYSSFDPTSLTLVGSFGGSDYYMGSGLLSWIDANAQAMAAGAHLVAIGSEEEKDYLVSLSLGTVLIGLNDIDSEGDYEWSNGEPATYFNWNGGEPNNVGDEDGVEMFANGTWNDLQVTSPRNYLIEVENSIDCEFSVDCNDPNLQGILGYELAKAPTAEDECKLDRIDMITNDTTLGCPSIIVREWLAYDACGNETCDTFRQTITIFDTIPPHLVCPNGGNTINLAVEETCDTTIELSATADDCDAFAGSSNLDETSWQYSLMNTDDMSVLQTGTTSTFTTVTLPLGNYMVMFTVSDLCGNMQSCQTSIIVTDGSDPSIDCDNVTDEDGTIISGTTVDTFTNVDADGCGLEYRWRMPAMNDNCDDSDTSMISYSATGATVFSGTRIEDRRVRRFFNLGTTVVQMWSYDPSGNPTDTCEFTINVSDDDAPDLACSLGGGMLCEIWESSDVGKRIPTDPNSTSGPTLSVVMPDGGDITDLNVNVSGLHTWAGDLIISLKHPDGTTATLVDQVNELDPNGCGCPGNNFNLTFDDEAANTANDLENQSCDGNTDPNLFELEGTYQSVNPLSVFDGKPTAGIWELTILDNCGGDIGSLEAFSLEVCSDAAEDLLQDTVAYTNSNWPGDCYFELNFKHPFLRENCNLVSYEIQYYSDPSGAPDSTEAVVSLGSATKKFPVGTTTVKYVAIDGAGLMDMCSFEVTVIDNEAPQALCKDITVYLDANGEVTIDSNAVDNGSTDNCEIASFSTDITEFDCDDLGANTVTLTVTDASGNSFDCWSTVTVLDTITPTIECPADTTLFTSDGPIIVSRAAGDCTFLIEGTTFDPVYDDNCPVTVYLDIHDGTGFQETSSLDGFILENADTTYTFTWKVVDASSNEASCTFNITLEDDEQPSFNYCPDNVVENTVDTDCNQEAKWHPPFITDLEDNCAVLSISGPYSDDEDLVFDFSDADTTRALFKVGDTEVWYVAEDVNGNKDTCSFTVTIIDDVQPVIVSCPADVVHVLNSSCDVPVMTLADYKGSIIYTENCDATVTQVPADGTMWGDILGRDPVEGDTVVVTLTVDDGSNAAVSCSFNVTFDDKQPPSITCPADQTVYVDASCAYTLADFTGMATASDNCGSVTVTQSPSGTVHTAGDVVTVTLTADDGNGNTSSCTFDVTIKDNLAPKFVDCRDTALALAPGNCTVTFDGNLLTPAVTDNCPGAISVVGVRMDGGDLNGTYNAGLTIIEWTATDANGVQATCTSTVDVSIIGLPNCNAGDITISLNEFGKAVVCGSNLDEGSTSACGAPIVARYIQRMDGSPAVECDTFTCADVNMVNGVAQPTMVMLVIEDADGNMMMCMGSVTVKDLLPPVIVDCPDDQVLFTDTMVCTAYVNIEPVEIKAGLINGASIPYTTADNCPVDTLYEITYSAASGWGPVSGSGDPSGDFPKGTSTIVWTIVDVGLNTATCTTTITVNDNEAPLVTCPDASTVGGNAAMDGDTIVIGTSYDDDYDCDAIVQGLTPTVWDNCNMGDGGCSPTTLLFTEYVEGSSNNKCVEIFNGTGADVELSDYSVVRYTNGSSSGTNISLNAGTLSSGSVWVLCNSQTTIYTADQTSGSLSHNGDDALGLMTGGVIVDAIGQIGVDPGSAWSANGCSTQNSTLARNPFDNCSGSDGTGAFDPSVWASAGCLGIDDVSGLGVAPAMPMTSTVDPCPITVTYAIEGATTASGSDDASGTNFLQGLSKLTYTAVDDYGNIGTCEAWIKIVDDQKPLAICKDTLDVYLDMTGSVSILPADVDNGSSDNCMIDFMTLSDSTFTCDECPGKDVTLTVYDKDGNAESCVTYVRINDPIAPTINCMSDQNRATSDDETSADIDAGLTDCDYVASNGEFDPTWSDNCLDDVVISYSFDGGATETVASTLDGYVFGNADTTYNVLWIARDKANMSTCTLNITIEDDEDPIPTCTEPVFALSSDDGKYDCGTYVTITPTTATDNCGIASIVNASPFSDANGADASGVYPVGTTVVPFFITDVNGNLTTCSVTVTVEDDQNPRFRECAGDTTLTADANLCSANYTLLTRARDNCAINQIDWTIAWPDGSTGSGTSNFTSEDFCIANPTYDFPVGCTTIDWIAYDIYGNSRECQTVICVTDDENPMITCPTDVVQTADPGACSANVSGLIATATDNCEVESMSYSYMVDSIVIGGSTLGATIDASGNFAVGSYIIEFIAVDSSGNADTCYTSVTITDDEDPTITCPADIVMDTDSAKCDAIVVVPLPVTNDNCEVDTFYHDSPYATVGGNDASGTYPEGTTVVSYTVVDIHGNTETCSFSITIEDNEKPLITCSGGGTRTTSQDSLQFNLPGSAYDCGYTVGNAPGSQGEFDPVSFSDNCCITSVVHDYTAAPSLITLDGAVLPVGTTIITWTITDCHGNSEVCSDEITVTDNETPVAKCKPDNCRFNLPTSGVFTLPQATIDQLFRPGNFDNCTSNEDLDIQISQTSFDCSNIGENLITLTVTDEAGNSAFCTFIIEILENTPPDCFAQDITVYLDATGVASIETADIDANSTDNCGIDTMYLDMYDFDCTNVGDNTVTLTVLDQNTFPGPNVSTCTATVTVVDTIAPVCSTKDIIVVLDSLGVASIDSNSVDDGSADACGIASITVDIDNFSCADVGNPVTVTQTVTDENGNVSTCTATVSVIDDIAPECLTMDLVVYLDDAGEASIDSNAVDAGSNDACGIASITLDITDFTCVDLDNPVTVTQTVTDNNGQVSTCTAMIVVMDTIAPICETMDITLYLDANGEVSIDSNAVDNGSSDNCEISSISLDRQDFTCADVGTVTVTQTVTDGVGGGSTPAGYSFVGNFEGSNYYISTSVSNWTTAHANAAAAGGYLADINSVEEDSFITANTSGLIWIGLTDSESYGGSESAGTSNPALDGWVWTSGAPVTYVNWSGGEPNNSGNEDFSVINWFGGGWNDLSDNDQFHSPTFALLEIPAGNSSTCTATITIIDTIAPEMVCNDVTIYLDENGNASITVADLDGGATDACGIADVTADQLDFDCSEIGKQLVTVTATDVNGNVSTCLAEVTVVDSIAPAAVCTNIVVQLENGAATITADQLNGGSSDNCTDAADLLIAASQTFFTCADVGDVIVTITVTDLSGNESTCEATVTVEDNEAPVAICQDVTVEVNGAGVGILNPADLVGVGTSDICDTTLTYAASRVQFDCSDVGDTILVDLYVTDANGNSDTCTAAVAVVDNVTPTIVCNQTFDVILTSEGMGSIDVADLYSDASDNCGAVNVSFQSNGGGTMQVDCSDIGQNLFVLVATDASGNENICEVTVNVIDATNPEALCQDVTVSLVGGVATVDASQVDAGSSDECGCIDTMMLDQTEFTTAGTFPVVLTVFDCNGNFASCTANVVVTSTALIETEFFTFLEGAYDFGAGEMTTTLNINGHIPLAQPYNEPGYNYTGTETLTSVPATMTDWVLVRLFDGASSTVMLGEQAAVLHSDGSITDVNGANLMFPAASSYRVEIHHWTALAISSPGGLGTDSLGILHHDFREDMSMAMTNGAYTNGPMADLFDGNYGMTAGNSLYVDNNTDLNDIGWAYSQFGTFGRSSSDVNLDGVVDLIDVQIIFFNLFKFSHIP